MLAQSKIACVALTRPVHSDGFLSQYASHPIQKVYYLAIYSFRPFLAPRAQEAWDSHHVMLLIHTCPQDTQVSFKADGQPDPKLPGCCSAAVAKWLQLHFKVARQSQDALGVRIQGR